jgi:hypothetical protein
MGLWLPIAALLMLLPRRWWKRAGSTAPARRAIWLVWAAAASSLALGLLAFRQPLVTLEAEARLLGSLLPLVLLLAAAGGLSWALVEARLGAWILLSPLALFALGPAQSGFYPGAHAAGLSLDQSESRLAETYAAAAMMEAPENALVIANRLGATDLLLFPLLYRQIALGERPDVTLIDRSLLEAPWYRRQLLRRRPFLAAPLAALEDALAAAGPDQAAQRRASRAFFSALLAESRPVCFTDAPGPQALGGLELVPQGVLWRVPGQASAWQGHDPLAAPLAHEPQSPYADLFRDELQRRAAARDQH